MSKYDWGKRRDLAWGATRGLRVTPIVRSLMRFNADATRSDVADGGRADSEAKNVHQRKKKWNESDGHNQTRDRGRRRKQKTSKKTSPPLTYTIKTFAGKRVRRAITSFPPTIPDADVAAAAAADDDDVEDEDSVN